MTKEAADETEEKEMDDLLGFFEQNNMSDFSQDQEIKHLLSNLKGKIEEMRQQENWKQKQNQRLKARQVRQEQGGE